MSGQIPVHSLLNPSTPPLVDIAPLIRRLYVHLDLHGTLHAPPRLQRELHEYVATLGPSATYWPRRTSAAALPSSPHRQPSPPPPPPPPPPPAQNIPLPPVSILIYDPLALHQPNRILQNVKISNRTTLHRLYVYETPNVFIEYPETHQNGIGYMFRLDPENWQGMHIIMGNSAYSVGAPAGQTKAGEYVNHTLFQIDGQQIPCMESHKTCQGSKICPFSDLSHMREGHCVATRELIAARLADDRDQRIEVASPSAEVFNRTLNYILALQRVGCCAMSDSENSLDGDADPTQAFLREYQIFLQRGYHERVPQCQGDLQFIEEHDMQYVQCEHYHNMDNRNHFRHRLDESFHSEYIEAVLEGDIKEAKRIELAVESLGYGPNVECTTVTNASSQRLNCPYAHRNADGMLYQPPMNRLDCDVKFRVVEPAPEYRQAFPYALLTLRGVHRHPVPLPQKTPPLIRAEIHQILAEMGTDIADMTVRRFLRSSPVLEYVRKRFPNTPYATLSDVHVSLANRAHLRMYIKAFKDKTFPKGTGWDGACLLFDAQQRLDSKDQYIRRILNVPAINLTTHDEDRRIKATDRSDFFRAIICMTAEQSELLVKAQYLQSDISFKRVVSWREFILAGLDRASNTIIVFVRVYMNRESAEAHRMVLEAIELIVLQDTGGTIQWRHIYADRITDTDGLTLLWTGDQHGGQAKGIGLHLYTLCRGNTKLDLHEVGKRLCNLTPYDHLHRLFRLCVVHYMRNVHDGKFSEDVKKLMLSLVCVNHSDWDGTIALIKRSGKKAADWLANKISSYFAFEGICQSKSKIPLEVWRAGDRNSNIVEVSHFHVNLEGVRCSLVSAILKAYNYDLMRLSALHSFETAGIRPTYDTGTRYENSAEAIKKHSRQQIRRNTQEDEKISKHNAKVNEVLRKADVLVIQGGQQYQRYQFLVNANYDPSIVALVRADLDKTEQSRARLVEEMRKLNQAAETLPRGSGTLKAIVPQIQ